MTSSRQIPRGRRGFSLIEVLMAIIIAGLALNVAARLIQLTIRSYGDSSRASKVLKMDRQWLEMMRRDAWQASSRSAGNGDRFVVDDRIIWRFDGENLVRESGEDRRSWPIGKRALRWSPEANGVLSVREGELAVPLASPALHQAGVP